MRFEILKKPKSQTATRINLGQELSLGTITRLKTVSALSNGAGTTLKTGLEEEQVQRNVTKTLLKSILKVYKSDGKFYIDHAAAYRFRLVRVRTVLTEQPHLVEVDEEFLKKYENDENIEIEYVELDKAKRPIVQETDGLSVVLSQLLGNGEYGIGVHGIDKGDFEQKQKTAENVVKEGLKINFNSKSILSTAVSLGTNKSIEEIEQEISEYQFGTGTKVSVVIAVPVYIKNQNGDKIFLGFPDENKRTSAQEYEEQCMLDRICAKMKKVPPEFILGYYAETPDGIGYFAENPSHYSKALQKEKESVYEEIESNMDGFSKDLNELIITGNVKKINEMIQRISFESKLLKNVLKLTEQYGTKKNVRQIMVGPEHESKEKKEPTLQKSRVRKVLVGAFDNLTTADLNSAQGLLQEGLEEQTKKNKDENKNGDKGIVE